jgi:hypothetical protein
MFAGIRDYKNKCTADECKANSLQLIMNVTINNIIAHGDHSLNHKTSGLTYVQLPAMFGMTFDDI